MEHWPAFQSYLTICNICIELSICYYFTQSDQSFYKITFSPIYKLSTEGHKKVKYLEQIT